MTHHILAGTKGQHPSLPFHWRKTGQMPQLLKSPWHGNCLGGRGGCCRVCVSLSEPQQIHLYLIKKVPGTCLNICPLYPVLSSGHHSTTAQHITLFHPQHLLREGWTREGKRGKPTHHSFCTPIPCKQLHFCIEVSDQVNDSSSWHTNRTDAPNHHRMSHPASAETQALSSHTEKEELTQVYSRHPKNQTSHMSHKYLHVIFTETQQPQQDLCNYWHAVQTELVMNKFIVIYEIIKLSTVKPIRYGDCNSVTKQRNLHIKKYSLKGKTQPQTKPCLIDFLTDTTQSHCMSSQSGKGRKENLWWVFWRFISTQVACW